MTIFMLFNFAFDHFFDWRSPASTNCKKPPFMSFLEKISFFAIFGFWGSPIKKIMKAKLKGIKISIS